MPAAENSVSRRRAVHGGPEFRQRRHLRSGDVGAGMRRMARSQFHFQLHGFSGAPREDSFQDQRRQAPVGAYLKRFGAGVAADSDRGAGELSERGRQRDDSRGLAALHGRTREDREDLNVKPTVGFTLPWAGVTPALSSKKTRKSAQRIFSRLRGRRAQARDNGARPNIEY